MNFEKILDDKGILVYKTRGVSMQPMLYQNRDLVIIKKHHQRLHKYDVALYKRRDQYVLHRVIKVCQEGYMIRGDNTYALERVPDSVILGVLVAFQRNGKKHDVADSRYLFYVRIWTAIYPLRFLAMKTKKLCRLLYRKLKQ